MPAPYQYDVQPVNALGSYRAGQQQRQQDDRQNALQQYLPGALRGNQGDVEQVAAADPDLGIKLTGLVRQMNVDQREQAGSDAVGMTKIFEGVNWNDPQDVASRTQAVSSILSPQAAAAFGSLKTQEERQAAVRHAGYMPEAIAAARETQSANDKHQQSLASIDRDRAGAAKDRAAAQPGVGDVALSPAAADFLIDQRLAGDRFAFSGIGVGRAGQRDRKLLQNRLAEVAKERGITGTQLAALGQELGAYGAAQRTAGIRGTNIEMAGQEFLNIKPTVLTAADKVDLSQYSDVNAFVNAWKRRTGDPNIIALGAAINGAVNTYGRAISPTGTPTDADKHEGRALLNAALARGQLESGLEQMGIEIQAAIDSPPEVRSRLHDEFMGKFGRGGGHQPQPTGTTPPASIPQDNPPPPNLLKAGQNTEFSNGQIWTVRNGKPVRVK